MRLRRRPFDDLVDQQLSLFEADEAALLREAEEAEDAWIRSGREDAEEAYGDYQLVVDAIADRLLDLRESYAATLAEQHADAYRHTFAATVKRRFGRYASLVADVESP
jgi:hypothetical protein